MIRLIVLLVLVVSLLIGALVVGFSNRQASPNETPPDETPPDEPPSFPVTLLYFATDETVCVETGDGLEYYTSVELVEEGVILYADDTLLQPVADGFYRSVGKGTELYYTVAGGLGEISESTVCPPPLPSSFPVTLLYKDTIEGICEETGNGLTYYASSELVEEGVILYADDTLLQPVADGFYRSVGKETEECYTVAGGLGEITIVATCIAFVPF
jgi:hypothetical protein